MRRRTFLDTLARGTAGSALLPAVLPAVPADGAASVQRTDDACDAHLQRLHPDAQTEPDGADYFFLGNGRIVAVVQHATGAALEAGLTPLGLLFWDPHHFARKWSTFTFHPEWGLRRGMVSLEVGEQTYEVDPARLTVAWTYPGDVPVVEARWEGGPYRVVERYWTAEDAPLLVREVTVENASAAPQPVTLTTTLYHNHILFTDYRTDHEAGVLRADGYPHMELFSEAPVRLEDRKMHVDLGVVGAGAAAGTRLFYVVGAAQEDVAGVPAEARRLAAERFYDGLTSVATSDAGLDGLYRAARDGIHAVVSEAGRFDAGVWQYNMEWVVDASNVILAAVRTGQFGRAAAMVHHVVTRLTNERGVTAQSSRFHDDLTSEIGQNGILLGAVATYAAWTGDLALVRRLWPRIVRIAEYPLGAPFAHESGLLQTDIDFFERTAGFGILRGFELGYQSVVAWGLARAAELARQVGDDAHAGRWAAASERIATAMRTHPAFALVEDGVFIKRRTLDGRWQQTLVPEARGTDFIPPGMPLAEEDAPLLDPEITTLYPLLFGQAAAADPVAQATIDRVETLWNVHGMGGYARYHPSGEPDSPGAWAFPTAIVGRALAEGGRAELARRALDWYLGVPRGGAGGAFFEFYHAGTPRPVPPLPPTGFVVWAWAELASCFVEQILGARAGFDALRFAPRRVAGLDDVRGRLRIRDAWVDVHVRHGTGAVRAVYDGRPLARDGDAFVLPLPATGGTVEIEV